MIKDNRMGTWKKNEKYFIKVEQFLRGENTFWYYRFCFMDGSSHVVLCLSLSCARLRTETMDIHHTTIFDNLLWQSLFLNFLWMFFTCQYAAYTFCLRLSSYLSTFHIICYVEMILPSQVHCRWHLETNDESSCSIVIKVGMFLGIYHPSVTS